MKISLFYVIKWTGGIINSSCTRMIVPLYFKRLQIFQLAEAKKCVAQHIDQQGCGSSVDTEYFFLA